MKDIYNYIFEKLQVNSKTKINNIEDVCKYIYYDLWGFTDEDEEIFQCIKDWVKNNDLNDIDDIIPVAGEETLNEMVDFMGNNNKILKLYKSNINMIDKAQEKLEKAKNIYSYHEKGEHIDILSTDDMIAILGLYGALYCIKK